MNPMPTPYRYALYYAPPVDHPLWAAGCQWLQRNPAQRGEATGGVLPRPHITEPQRYGFHATLKPPFRLREPHSGTALLGAVAQLAARTLAFPMPPLQVAWLGDFLALRPVADLPREHALRRLADACVDTLDLFRAPPDDTERDRRAAQPLSDAQRVWLDRYGYPYVMDEWRFHMTLTDKLPASEQAKRDAIAAQAREHFAAALAVPLVCDSLCVYVEPERGQPFVLTHRFGLKPS
jgi:putative phosphonate metabolism protein